ncbi:MAG TPA: GNAT family N-acetyltransferase [Candidatus Alistipes faecavium]|nr:GNAT family N-acetyltransferase [Candidatus Alistipes faecavium]
MPDNPISSTKEDLPQDTTSGGGIVRPLREEEYGLLKDFLYDAIFVPEGADPPSRDVVDDPALSIYYEGFGTQRSDRALCAEIGGRIVGVVWCRATAGFGQVAGGIPELAMSVKALFRKRGIGKRLLRAMLEALKKEDFARVSLSVQKANFAYAMYLKAGFRVFRETEKEYIMVCDL